MTSRQATAILDKDRDQTATQVGPREVCWLPIYEFECGACGHRFEELCRVGEDGSSLKCPACGAKELRRRPSVFSARSGAGPGGGSASLGGSGCPPT